MVMLAGSRTNLSYLAVWKEIGSLPYSEFGMGMASGDVNRDGFADLVVGAPGFNPTATVNASRRDTTLERHSRA